jgi:hypothetical protein
MKPRAVAGVATPFGPEFGRFLGDRYAGSTAGDTPRPAGQLGGPFCPSG